MGETTGIQWTQASWNPWHGCHKISAGCDNCYMFAEKKRYGQDPDVPTRSKTTFAAPLKWKEPKLIFTCSWSDFFIGEADPWRQEAYEIMRITPQHTYQVLTKRIGRVLLDLPSPSLPNMWLGVSVENRAAKSRIAMLRECDVALRFLSIEPLLEDIGRLNLDGIHWVIVGGESGNGARPFDIGWGCSIVEQCRDAGVPCFVKQLGSVPRYRNHPDKPTALFNGLQQLYSNGAPLTGKGGNIDEWPIELRVREMPVHA